MNSAAFTKKLCGAESGYVAGLRAGTGKCWSQPRVPKARPVSVTVSTCLAVTACNSLCKSKITLGWEALQAQWCRFCLSKRRVCLRGHPMLWQCRLHYFSTKQYLDQALSPKLICSALATSLIKHRMLASCIWPYSISNHSISKMATCRVSGDSLRFFQKTFLSILVLILLISDSFEFEKIIDSAALKAAPAAVAAVAVTATQEAILRGYSSAVSKNFKTLNYFAQFALYTAFIIFYQLVTITSYDTVLIHTFS